MKSKFLTFIIFVVSLSSFSYSFEIITQDLRVADGWQEIELEHSYTEPIIVTGGLTNNGIDVVAEIGSITSESFQVRIRDWGYEQTHTAEETVTIMVMERGETTYGGLTILADKHTFEEDLSFFAAGQTTYLTFPLSTSIVKHQNSTDIWNFVMMAQAIYNEGVTIPLMVRNHNEPSYTDQFRVRFAKGEFDDASVNLDEFHYIAFQTGETDDTVPTEFQVFNTPAIYNISPKPLALDNTIVDPALMINMPIVRGGDSMTIRYEDLVTGSVNLLGDEAPARDNTYHTGEEVSVVLIGENPDFIAPEDFEAIAVRRSLTIGNNAATFSMNSVAIGENALTNENNSLAVGENATTNSGTTLAVDGNTVLSGDLNAGNTTVDDLTVNGDTILNGNTALKGDVTMEEAQGDISMGDFGG